MASQDQLNAAYKEGYEKRADEEKEKLQDAYSRGYQKRATEEKPVSDQKLQDAYLVGYNTRKGEEEETHKKTLGKEFHKLCLELRAQGAAQHIRTFEGEDSEKYQSWLRDMEKTLTQLGHDDARARILTLQSLSGPASDFASREITKDPHIPWKKLKEKLDNRYNDMSDIAFAKQKLRRIVQKRSESVQNFYERLLTVARSAYTEDKLKNEFVQQQLVEYFTDGILCDNTMKRLVRKKPETLDKALEFATEEQQIQRAFGLRRGQDSTTEHTPMEVDVLVSGNTENTEIKELLKEILHNTKQDRPNTAHIPVRYVPNTRPPPPGDDRGRFVRNPRDADKECYRCHRIGHIAVNCRVPAHNLMTSGQYRPFTARPAYTRQAAANPYDISEIRDTYQDPNTASEYHPQGESHSVSLPDQYYQPEVHQSTYAQVLSHPAGWYSSLGYPKNE